MKGLLSHSPDRHHAELWEFLPGRGLVGNHSREHKGASTPNSSFHSRLLPPGQLDKLRTRKVSI